MAPFWVYVLLPSLTFLVAALGLVVAVIPLLRRRFQDRSGLQRRLELTQDVVLGRREDLSRGRAEVVGLVRKVPELERRIESVEDQISDQQGHA